MTDSDDSRRGIVGRVSDAVARTRDRAVAAGERLLRIAPGLDVGLEVLRRFNRLNGSVLVGHIAYRMFVWMIPLLLVAVGILGYSAAQEIDIVRCGSDVGLDEEALNTTADQASDAALPVGIVAALALLWATRGLVRGLFFVFSQAWEMPRQRPRKIVTAVAATAVCAIVAVALAGAISVLAGKGVILFVATGLAGIAAMTLLVIAIMWLLPHRAPSVLHLLPGTALAVAGLVLVDLVGGLYFPRRLSSASATYGSIGLSLVLLLFLWLWAFLLVGSAFVNAVWCDRAAVLDGRPYIAAPEALPAWLRRRLFPTDPETADSS